MIALILLILVNAFLLATTREPQEFVEVKEKYETLRRHIKESEHPKFQMLCRPIPITGFKKMNGTVGECSSMWCWASASILIWQIKERWVIVCGSKWKR